MNKLKLFCSLLLVATVATCFTACENGKNEPKSATGSHEGHDYVDLGLSVKWATCNVGAIIPENCGNYYAWGETQTKSYYDWSTYKYCTYKEEEGYNIFDTFTKYNTCLELGSIDNKTVLDLSDDAAHANWGGQWRTPTSAEWKELAEKCICTLITRNGVNGYEIKATNGNSIFIPINKPCYCDYYDEGVDFSLYMSASLYPYEAYFAYSSMMSNDEEALGYEGLSYRCVGHSVRPVYGKESEAEELEHYEFSATGSHEGHDYVDLGLSVKWATCNIGASKVADYSSLHFAWGETQIKTEYSWDNYKYGTEENRLTKYCTDSNYGKDGFTDDKTVLDLSDDAAHSNWGGQWRMPTYKEFDELREKCIWTWILYDGVSGYEVKGTNGNSIFLPATSNGYGYWSSTNRESYAYQFLFQMGQYCFGLAPRYSGSSVRPVLE